jgi:NADH:ubiquinone oxidoreductase subunit H
MTSATFNLVRVWAMVTGLLLAGWYFVELQADIQPSQVLSMLVTAIGGFELFLYVQDRLGRKRKDRGHG